MLICLASSGACLLPPEGETDIPPFPPEVDFNEVLPREPLLRLRLDCLALTPSVRLLDRDSRELRLRWVVNNNLPGTRLLQEDVFLVDPGVPRNEEWRVTVALDLGPGGAPPQLGDVAILSFFVTDAPDWVEAAPEPGARPPDEQLNLGRIPEGAGSAVEVRWSFVFSEVGSCPGPSDRPSTTLDGGRGG